MLKSDFAANTPGTLVQTSGVFWDESQVPIRQVRYDGPAFVPHPLPPQIDWDSLGRGFWTSLTAAIEATAELRGVSRTLPNPHLLSSPFSIREAQASSRIEDTIASAEDIVLESRGVSSRSDSREVQNYLNALEAGLAIHGPIGQVHLREMHKILLDGVRGDRKRPGEYRQSQALIGTIDHPKFVPPPAEFVPDGMNDLERVLRDKPGEPWPNPLLVTAAAHYQFETIHPFADGNGRLGRMLILLLFCKWGILDRPLIYLSSYFDRFRDTYYRCLREVSTHNSWTQWFAFFCEGVAIESADAIKRARRLISLRAQLLDRVTEPNAPARLRDLTDKLFTTPAVRTKDVSAMLGVGNNQAQRYIDRLEALHILREVTGGKYNRVWVCDKILAVIETDSLDHTNEDN